MCAHTQGSSHFARLEDLFAAIFQRPSHRAHIGILTFRTSRRPPCSPSLSAPITAGDCGGLLMCAMPRSCSADHLHAQQGIKIVKLLSGSTQKTQSQCTSDHKPHQNFPRKAPLCVSSCPRACVSESVFVCVNGFCHPVSQGWESAQLTNIQSLPCPILCCVTTSLTPKGLCLCRNSIRLSLPQQHTFVSAATV